MNPFSSVTIIGYGAVGSSLVDFFRHSGINLKSVWDRKPEVALLSDGKELKPAGKAMPDSADETGELILISVPDAAIPEIVKKLSAITGDLTGKYIAHLSGSRSAEILSSLKKSGASTASIHPLQTFPGKGGRSRLNGIRFTLQGDDQFLDRLEVLVKLMGSSSIKVNEKQKTLLHLTAVFASNYMISLLDIANEVAEAGKIDNSLELLEPILRQTLDNILTDGTSVSLSGPVSRGDTATIIGHIEMLRNHAELLHAYKLLGNRALKIAEISNRITPEKVSELKKLFEFEE